MDDAEARAILREHGEQPPKRGNLGATWHARAQQLADFGPQPVLAPNGDGPGDDYDHGVTPADFDDVSAAADPPPDRPAEGPPEPPAVPGQAEQRPRRVRPPRKPLAERLRSAGGQGKGKGRKKHHPRVRVDGLISRGWEILGSVATRVDPPVGRCLILQAPIAGLVLEDVVRDTVIDRGLQPIARVEEKAELVASLVLPPLLVGGLEAAQRLPEPQRKAREAVLWPLLVESLILSDRVAGAYSEEVLARAERDAPKRERATRMANLIFGIPEVAPEAADREPAGV